MTLRSIVFACFLLSLAPMRLRATPATEADCSDAMQMAMSVAECYENTAGGRWMLESLGIADSWRSLSRSPKFPVFPDPNANYTSMSQMFDAQEKAGRAFEEAFATYRREIKALGERVKAFVEEAIESSAVRAKLCGSAHDLVGCARDYVFGDCSAVYQAKYDAKIAGARQQLTAFEQRNTYQVPAMNLARQAFQVSLAQQFEQLPMAVCAICADDAKLRTVLEIGNNKAANVTVRLQLLKRDPMPAVYELLGRCGTRFGRAMAAVQPTGNVADACELEPAMSCTARLLEEKMLGEEAIASSLLEKLMKIWFKQIYNCPLAQSEAECARRHSIEEILTSDNN